MPNKIHHPGKLLLKLMDENELSQRELASKIDIAHSLLNSILKGSRNINVTLALSLQAAGFNSAEYWMSEQMKYSLYDEGNKPEIAKRNELIKAWNELGNIVPISYFKKQDFLKINSSDDIDKIYEIYGVRDLKSLKSKVENFDLSYFRKSSKFVNNRNNIVAWSLLAEYKAKHQEVGSFRKSDEKNLIEELKKCFYLNNKTLSKSKKILNKYGIKFFILDRPPQTPVDGKSFMSGKNPVIVLSLKYKRLDNFAFTLFHEICHVYRHFTNPKLSKEIYLVNNKNSNEIEEFEADNYAKNQLIDSEAWNEFFYSYEEFTDDVIREFSKKIKVHPAIIRGRLCFEKPEYYRKRTLINKENILSH